MAGIQKTSWADDVDELEQPKKPGQLPPPTETVDENGIRTVVEYSYNEEGQPIKITRKIRRVAQKTVVNHSVAERKAWAKFGQEKGNKPGPDRATTTLGEVVYLKLSAGNKSKEPELSEEQTIKANLAKAGAGKVTCRLCKGDHFTAKCPYKDSLAGLDGAGLDAPPAGDDDGADVPSAAGGSGLGGKYIPPSMRAGGRGAGESMTRLGGGRDDLPTLRVTNVSEDTTDNDLRDLFSAFGRVARVYIGRDRETGVGKGYAFVSYEDRHAAERAIQKVNGLGYDNLILSVQWSQPRDPR